MTSQHPRAEQLADSRARIVAFGIGRSQPGELDRQHDAIADDDQRDESRRRATPVRSSRPIATAAIVSASKVAAMSCWRRASIEIRRGNKKGLRLFDGGLQGINSLTMSYFHTGTRNIIGAEAFHCPVRDGKEWDHLAMVIRHNRRPRHSGR